MDERFKSELSFCGKLGQAEAKSSWRLPALNENMSEEPVRLLAPRVEQNWALDGSVLTSETKHLNRCLRARSSRALLAAWLCYR